MSTPPVLGIPADNSQSQLRDKFPWPLFIASFALMLSGHAFSAAIHDAVVEGAAFWFNLACTLAAAGILFICARLLFKHRFEHRFLLSLMLVSVLTTDWLVLDAHHFLFSVNHWHWLAVVTCSLPIFIGLLILTHHWRQDLEGGRSLAPIATADYLKEHRIRALVLIVSKPTTFPKTTTPIFNVQFPSGNERFPICVKHSTDNLTATLTGKDIKSDIESVAAAKVGWRGNWNWQQLLRALAPHINAVECVWLVGSEQPYLDQARKLVSAYLPHLNEETLRSAQPASFEDFKALHGRLKDVLKVLENRKFRPSEIVLDITGGTTIASVTGAVLTLNRAVVCQYVQTAGLGNDECEPKIYDMSWDSPLPGH